MTGWATIKKIRDFEERAAKLGFSIQQPTAYNQHAYTTNSFKSVWVDEFSTESISLTPVDIRYPGWRRGSSVFTGTIEEGKLFLQGIEFAHMSDQHIGMSNEKKRKTYEGKYIDRVTRLEAAKKKREEQKKMWDLLKNGDNEDVDAVPF